jgi:hypothetical protein
MALTPSGPRRCSQIDPSFGSKTSANVKKGQQEITLPLGESLLVYRGKVVVLQRVPTRRF